MLETSEGTVEPLVQPVDHQAEIRSHFLERRDKDMVPYVLCRAVEASPGPRPWTRRPAGFPDEVGQDGFDRITDQDKRGLFQANTTRYLRCGVKVLRDLDRSRLRELERDDGERVAGARERFDDQLRSRIDDLS